MKNTMQRYVVFYVIKHVLLIILSKLITINLKYLDYCVHTFVEPVNITSEKINDDKFIHFYR